MKKFIYYSLLLIFVSSFSYQTASAQDTPSEVFPMPSIQPGPTTKMTFVETEYDFGIINAGEKVQQVFTFTNTGTEPLILSNVRGSCGCTVPQWPKDVISPSETASITVQFDSTNKKGPRVQKVTITANTDPPQTFIYLKGEVIPDADAALSTIENDPAKEILSMDCIAIYPNPTSDVLKLDLKESDGKTAIISIFSKSGQMMAEKTIEKIDGTIEFAVSHYPKGAYVANVQVEGQKPIAQCFMVGD